MSEAAAVAQPDSHLRGIAFKILYVICIVLMLTLVKLIDDVPLGEVMFFRCFFSILPIAGLLILRGELTAAFRTKRFAGHVTRTCLGLTMMGLTFVSVQALPLPETVTLQYTQPLFVVAFSALFLREAVGVNRWGAVAFGFAGVLVITWPNLSMLTSGSAELTTRELIGIAAALIAAAGVAVVFLLVRGLVKTEKPTTITAYFWLISSSLLALSAFGGGEPLTLEQTALLIACGILGGFGQLCMALSLQAAPASVTASFEYTSLLFAIGLGYFIFGDIPGINTLFGGAMVIAAGLFILWRESRAGVSSTPRRKLPPAP